MPTPAASADVMLRVMARHSPRALTTDALRLRAEVSPTQALRGLRALADQGLAERRRRANGSVWAVTDAGLLRIQDGGR